jgi:transposase
MGSKDGFEKASRRCLDRGGWRDYYIQGTLKRVSERSTERDKRIRSEQVIRVMPPHEASGRAEDNLPRRARRRSFTAEYKQRIVAEAAACRKKGQLAALLRREGLYASHLAAFRSAASRSGSGASAAEARAPRRASVQALLLQLARQERELARWRKRAERAEAMVSFQKKTFNLIDIPAQNAMTFSSSSRS